VIVITSIGVVIAHIGDRDRRYLPSAMELLHLELHKTWYDPWGQFSTTIRAFLSHIVAKRLVLSLVAARMLSGAAENVAQIG